MLTGHCSPFCRLPERQTCALDRKRGDIFSLQTVGCPGAGFVEAHVPASRLPARRDANYPKGHRSSEPHPAALDLSRDPLCRSTVYGRSALPGMPRHIPWTVLCHVGRQLRQCFWQGLTSTVSYDRISAGWKARWQHPPPADGGTAGLTDLGGLAPKRWLYLTVLIRF